MNHWRLVVALMALGLTEPRLSAADPTADEVAIRANAQKYVEAFNSGDGTALAALWAPEAVYLDSDTGESVKGRTAIAEMFQQRFAAVSQRPQLQVAVGSVRFITPEVALEDGRATLLLPSGETSESSYSAVSVKRDGVWLLESVRETVLPAPPVAADYLDPLAFLEGEWVDQTDTATVHSVYRWSANQAFLTQTYSVVIDGLLDMQGTQIIGWDPEQQGIRSWLFDSDGGFGEGRWEFDGDHWKIHLTSTLPDGRKASAVNILRPIDVDTIAWKSTARQVSGELLPSVDEFLITRVGGISRHADAAPAPDSSQQPGAPAPARSIAPAATPARPQ